MMSRIGVLVMLCIAVLIEVFKVWNRTMQSLQERIRDENVSVGRHLQNNFDTDTVNETPDAASGAEIAEVE